AVVVGGAEAEVAPDLLLIAHAELLGIGTAHLRIDVCARSTESADGCAVDPLGVLRNAIAVGVGPAKDLAAKTHRVGGFRQARALHLVVPAVAEAQHRSAFASQIERQTKSRRHGVPINKISRGGEA